MTVVPLIWDYNNEMQTTLSDPVYRKLATVLTSRIKRQTASIIETLDIPEGWVKKLIPHETLWPTEDSQAECATKTHCKLHQLSNAWAEIFGLPFC
jgi:hypothetical protein